MWVEIKECFESLCANPDCRVVVISGEGKHFCAGIDLSDMKSHGEKLASESDLVRRTKIINTSLKYFQDLEECSKPVIAATHSGCVGAGINLITAADIRLCTKDAFFQVKEVDLGLAADVGVLQRLPKIIGSQGKARAICFTGEKIQSDEAKTIGLVNEDFPDKDSLMNAAIKLAESIAEKSPVAVQNTKKNMIYSLDHTNQEGLDHIRGINIYSLQSEDFANGVSAQISNEKPEFGKL